jgi:hypothetical protein
MVRPTLMGVVTPCDKALLHLAGTMVRYAWQSVRTVLVVIDNGAENNRRSVMSRAASILGVEQTFHWQVDPTLSHRLARTVRAFQPGAIIATPDTLSLSREAWEIATDSAIAMVGVPLLHGAISHLWIPNGTSATIDVSLTTGIRHAVACLFAEGKYTVSEMRRTVTERRWAEVETFAQIVGASIAPPLSDLFAVPEG